MAPRWLSATEFRSRFSAERVNRLADIDNDGYPNEEAVERAIERAENRAESRLRRRYTAEDLSWTTSTSPQRVRDAVADLALYNLEKDGHDYLSEDAIRRRDDALSELDDIVRGDALLLSSEPDVDVAPGSTVTVSRGTTSSTYQRPLSLDNLDKVGW